MEIIKFFDTFEDQRPKNKMECTIGNDVCMFGYIYIFAHFFFAKSAKHHRFYIFVYDFVNNKKDSGPEMFDFIY